MRVLVIGGTGHIGTYLVPRLVEAGHEVIVMSRGSREPYQPHPAWAQVDRITVDKTEMEKNRDFRRPGKRAETRHCHGHALLYR